MRQSLKTRVMGRAVPAAFAFLLGVTGAVALENVLVVVIDDVGVDMLGTYCKPPTHCQDIDFPVTPNFDALKTSGVLFRNAWSNPTCSPTRATIQTGRYGFRTGVTRVTSPANSDPFAQVTPLSELPRCEFTIPEVLARAPGAVPARAAIGKWHLGNTLNGGPNAPGEAGYPHYAGAYANIGNYFNWIKTINGRVVYGYDEFYATTDNVNEASAWIRRQTGPWFLWLAFNAPHAPYHAPPPNLQNPDRVLPVCPGTTDVTRRQCYFSMIEALDKEFGRLKIEIGQQVLDQTTIIFLGDNGTPCEICDRTKPECQENHCKFSLYQGGINVPLIIAGAQVASPNRESNALVNTTDLYATAIELLTGLGPAVLLPPSVVLDSQSLVPVLNGSQPGGARQFVYSEIVGSQTVRNGRYKLIRTQPFDPAEPVVEQLYDLHDPELSVNNLLDGRNLTTPQRNNLEELRAQLTSILSSPRNDCDGDGIPQEQDNCREIYNPDQTNADGDVKGDPCDDCPGVANTTRNLPSAQVTYPTGGQTLLINDTVNLTWSATDDCGGGSITTIDLLLSRTGPDGPFTPLTLPGGIANSGSFAWTVTGPATTGFSAFLKVVAHNAVGNSGLALSGAGFKIQRLTQVCDCPSYCSGEGVRCTVTSCGANNCCNFTCGPDSTCFAPDPCPVNACGGCF